MSRIVITIWLNISAKEKTLSLTFFIYCHPIFSWLVPVAQNSDGGPVFHYENTWKFSYIPSPSSISALHSVENENCPLPTLWTGHPGLPLVCRHGMYGLWDVSSNILKLLLKLKVETHCIKISVSGFSGKIRKDGCSQPTFTHYSGLSLSDITVH